MIEHLSGCFFVDESGSTGKIFLYNTLLAKVRSSEEIAFAITSFGIVILLITDGRIAYS